MAGEFVYPPRISKQILVFRQKSSVNKPTLTPVLHDFVNIHVSPSEYVYLKCLFLTCGSSLSPEKRRAMPRKPIPTLTFTRYYKVVITSTNFTIYLNQKWCFSDTSVRVYRYPITGMYLLYLGLGTWLFFSRN